MALCSNPKNDEFCGISLCAGVGGLDLGIRIAVPEYRTVCFVERESFAASTLVARMEDACLHPAPIWDDLRSFDGRPWRGKVHIVSAGYPCQPFSLSGQRKGEHDPRHLWPEVRRIVDEIEPEFVFCENVAGHLSLGFQDVVGDLQEMGYVVTACVVSAAEVGATHTRERLFFLAHADIQIRRQSGLHKGQPCRPIVPIESQPNGCTNRAEKRSTCLDIDVGSVDRGRLGTAPLPLFTPAPSDFVEWGKILNRQPDLKPSTQRLADGLAHRMERTAAAGNGVVPMAAARAFGYLMENFK